MKRHKREPKVIRNCVHCKKVFTIHACRVRTGGAKYCSWACSHNRPPVRYWLGKKNIKFSELRKGKPSWNKGLKYPAISGERHWNWQGGKTSESLAARTSLEYKLWRKAIYERDNYICVMCGYHGNQLIADHIKSFSRYPELRFDINNGRTLCRPCHKTTPNYCGKVRVNIYA